MRHLVSLKETTAEEIRGIIESALRLKAERGRGPVRTLEGKTLIMLFQKTSTRTRLSYEAAMTELGGHAIFLDARTTQFSLADFSDEIRAITGFGQILMFRALRAADVEYAAALGLIPVIDGCSEKYHPSQALADVLTMSEIAGGIDRIGKVVWLGIENNVSNTLALACAKLGIRVVLATPERDPASVDPELDRMLEASGLVTRTADVVAALDGAAFVHTDTWMNMEAFESGKVKPEYREELERRKRIFGPYRLSAELVAAHAPEAKIMHCMPCHVGYEITREAIDHPNSVIFRQAENRLHAQKAILTWSLGAV